MRPALLIVVFISLALILAEAAADTGDLLWQETVPDEPDGPGNIIQQPSLVTAAAMPKGGFVVVGRINYWRRRENVDDYHGTKTLVVRLDPGGKVLWRRIYSQRDQSEQGTSVAALSDQGMLTASWLGDQCLIRRLDASGQVLWSTFVSRDLHCVPHDVAWLPDGRAVVVGQITAKGDRMFTTWLDHSGKILSEKYFSEPELEWGVAVAPVAEGDATFIATGRKIDGSFATRIFWLDDKENVRFGKEVIGVFPAPLKLPDGGVILADTVKSDLSTGTGIGVRFIEFGPNGNSRRNQVISTGKTFARDVKITTPVHPVRLADGAIVAFMAIGGTLTADIWALSVNVAGRRAAFKQVVTARNGSASKPSEVSLGAAVVAANGDIILLGTRWRWTRPDPTTGMRKPIDQINWLRRLKRRDLFE